MQYVTRHWQNIANMFLPSIVGMSNYLYYLFNKIFTYKVAWPTVFASMFGMTREKAKKGKKSQKYKIIYLSYIS